MTGRDRVAVAIEPMSLSDIEAVQAIERASFTTPWPPQAYRQELETNRLARYLVARRGTDVVGYGGIWMMVDEAHITTFAVHPRWRRRRIGEQLLLAMLDIALDRNAREATLEVRLSNLAARRLYEKYGFRPVGIRPRYYSDDGEDALIMTTDPLASSGMRDRVARLRGVLDAELAAAVSTLGGDAAGPDAGDVVDLAPEPSPPRPDGRFQRPLPDAGVTGSGSAPDRPRTDGRPPASGRLIDRSLGGTPPGGPDPIGEAG